MKSGKYNRAIRWLLNGFLLILFFPMVIPASDAYGLVSDRLFKVFPMFLLLLGLRILVGKNK